MTKKMTYELMLLLEKAKEEINWWADEHSCCDGRKNEVLEEIEMAIKTLKEFLQ